jgi:preprotein translocase subunit SecD
MKLCPACSRLYDDDNLRFCLDDGGQLVDKASGTPAPPTLTLPASQSNVPTMKQAFQPAPARAFADFSWAVNKKRSVLPWLLGAIALLLLGSTIVLGFFLLRPKGSLPWHLTLELDQGTPNREAAVRQTVDVLKNRLNAYDLRNFEVLPQGNGRITVNLPVVNDPERLKALITQGGRLELAHVISPPSPAPTETYATKEAAMASLVGKTMPASRRVLPYTEREGATTGKWVVVEVPAIVNGSELRTAEAARSPSGGDDYQIRFSLNDTGGNKFGAWTEANINEYIGVILNDEVKSIAFIKSRITNQGEITGRFTKQSAEDLALVLRTGALPATVKLISETTDK